MFNIFEYLIKDYETIPYLELAKRVRKIAVPIFLSLYLIRLFQIYDGDNKVVLFTYSFVTEYETIVGDVKVTFFEAVLYLPILLFIFGYVLSFLLALMRRF